MTAAVLFALAAVLCLAGMHVTLEQRHRFARGSRGREVVGTVAAWLLVSAAVFGVASALSAFLF